MEVHIFLIAEKRKITIHLLGAEKEADLLPLFECLLPLIPKTDIAIHMIGNAISQDIPPQQRAMCIRSISAESSIFMSITPSLYQPQHLDGTAFALPDNVPEEVLASQNFGTGAPDLIIEILSPGNSRKEVIDKYEIYQEAGVKEYWVIYPVEQVLQVYILENATFVAKKPKAPGDIYASELFPELKINVESIFEGAEEFL